MNATIKCKYCDNIFHTWTLQNLKVHLAGVKNGGTEVVPCPRDKVDVEIRKRILQDITVVENEERTAKKLKTAKESAAITKHFTPVPKETAANLAILEFLIANGNKSTRNKPLKLKLSAQPCQKKQ